MRIGDEVRVLVESLEDGVVEGRAEQQGPEVDGSTQVIGDVDSIRVGDVVTATVVATEGVDLVARTEGASA